MIEKRSVLNLPAMHSSTDIKLVSRLCCKEASESDWREFYLGYQRLIRSWCLKAGVPPSDLDDVFHDILVKLVSSLKSYQRQDGSRFRSWLKTVVMNSVTDRLRVSENNPFPQLLSDPDVARDPFRFSQIDGLSELAEELTEKTNSAAVILASVRERVAEATWNAFVQRELMQIEASAVAEELGIKKASVYQSCSRVRTIIKEESEKYFGD
jgi:RNA polymerase sigma factor (sigma-70 family)